MTPDRIRPLPTAPLRIPRRRFLRRAARGTALAAALAGVAPRIVPARVLGRDGGVAPSNRITVGFIGTGRQATYANLPGFLREPDAQVVALCDVDGWRLDHARKVLQEHDARSSGPRTADAARFRDWRELIARRDIDAVMISTPDHWHVPIAIAAVRAGKDVACEKPLTRSIAEGRLLCDHVTKARRVFRTDSEFRSNRTLHRAVQLVRNGRLGTLRRVITATPKDPTLPAQPEMPVPPELDYDLWQGPAPERPYTEQRVHPRHDVRGRPGWICISDYADGMMANWGAHLNDIALWAMDCERTGPVEIEGTGTFPPKGNLWDVILEFEVHFRFANGVQLTCKTDRPYIRFEGTEGWIQVHYPQDIQASHDSLLSGTPAPGDVLFPFKTSEKRDFLDAIATRGSTQGDAEVGHRNTSLAHLARIAIDCRQSLTWDPVHERFPHHPKAQEALRSVIWREPWKSEVLGG